MNYSLRIGMVCYPLIGGSGILATALGMELAARGHEVHFVSYARPVRLAAGLPGIHFHEVRVNDYALFRYPDYTLPLAVKLAAVAREHRLDLFHVHYAVPHATAAFLARQMLGGGTGDRPKLVTTLHGTDTNLLGQDPGYRPAIEHALEHSDAITTVSESLRRETLGTFSLSPVAAGRVQVIHNFYRPLPPLRDRAAVRRELGVGEDEFLAVHLSNLRPGKRIDLLLRALAATRHPDGMRLLILGGGDFTPLRPLLDDPGLRGRVIVREDVGAVDEYLAAADAGVSTSELESFGLSLLETLSQGRPVVAFAVGGIPELVTDGENGFLHPFGDVAGLAASLDRLAGSAELANAMGERGRADVARRFGPERIVAQYEGVYRRLLNG